MHGQARQNIHLVSLLNFISETNFLFKGHCVRFWPCLVCETATPFHSSQSAHIMLIYTGITSTHPAALSQTWHTLLSLSCCISARLSVFQEPVSTRTFKRNRVSIQNSYSITVAQMNLSPLRPLSFTYHTWWGFFCRISSHLLNSLPSLTPESLNCALHLLDAWHRIHTFRPSSFPVLHPEDHITQFVTSLDPGQRLLTLVFRPTAPSV